MINKVLSKDQYRKLINSTCGKSLRPEMDVALVELHHRAGLPPSEIALITVEAITDSKGGIARTLRTGGTASGLLSREVPILPDVANRLKSLIKASSIKTGFVFVTRTGKKRPAGALASRLRQLYLLAGFSDMPPGIGRCCYARTLIEGLNGVHFSLRDVQYLMGLRSLSSVKRFVLPSDRVVGLLNRICDELEVSSINDAIVSIADEFMELREIPQPSDSGFPADEMRELSIAQRNRSLSMIR